MRDVLEVDEEEARDVAGEVSSERTHGIKYDKIFNVGSILK